MGLEQGLVVKWSPSCLVFKRTFHAAARSSVSTSNFHFSVFSTQSLASPFYIGGGVGSGQAGNFCSDVPANVDCEDEGSVVRLFAGAKFTRFFGLELSVDSLNDLVTPITFVVNQDGETDLTSLGFTSIVFVPVSNRVSLYASFTGSLNMVSVKVDPNVSSLTTSTNVTSSTEVYAKNGEASVSNDLDWWDLFDDNDNNENSNSDEFDSDLEFSNAFTLGVEVEFTKHFYGRAQFRRYKSINGELGFGGREDVDMLSANALWRF